MVHDKSSARITELKLFHDKSRYPKKKKKKIGREDQSCPWSWLELRSRIYHVSYKKIRVIYHVREDQSWSRIYHVSYISSSLPGYIMVGKIRVAPE